MEAQINILSFVNEMEKIAAHKCRGSAVPIRVARLAKSRGIDKRDKFKTKISSEAQAAGGLLKRLAKQHAGKAALVGGGIAAWETGKQGVKDWQLGRAYRKQSEQ